MNRLALVVPFVTVTLLAGCQATSSGGQAAAVHTSSPGSSAPGSGQSTPPVPSSPKPDARYTHSCDYLLGNFSDGPHGLRFIAQAEIHNTGNVGISAKVTASWIQVGSKDLTRSKTVKVAWHHNRQVNFTVDVTQDNIDQIQAFNGLNDCHVKATIVSTFGATH